MPVLVQATASEAQPAASTQTLFARLGGGKAVQAAVDIFYDKMLSDDRINYFFEGIDMRRQRAHQAVFLTYALGGAKTYEGRGMEAAHERLAAQQGMTLEHFDIVLEHLGGALRDLSVPEDDIGEAAAIVETLRPQFRAAIEKAHA